MLILLPPSETKRTGGTGEFDPARLSRDAILGAPRAAVRAALETVSADEEAAVRALKLGTKNRGEREHNLALSTSGVMPVMDRYTGVLYDALDAPSLDPAAREWLAAHVAVQSALFGVLGLGEEIPAYRVSAGSRLPELGSPLKRLWSDAHAELDWARAGLILDLRSLDYVALAPLPRDRGWFVHVSQRGDDGVVRALNHFNKAAKGDLVRRLARAGEDYERVEDLLDWATAEGLELTADPEARELTLITRLGAPARTS
ncbi:YaaA family protein [Leucobacter chromiireducens]|uniref:Peroxide stress protein YaaA n=1 Tax=Leucobacter chromiireducens subsp. solipictus TaxID=398235 RepID=A0ABS1SHC0_9MICO|nr:peroxide stress protein YaaA [Leucobacter chromiireducens]MBL3679930.1 peroxide stress protein YaaA [Leucobacter chromiireducens subsp. solipictus]